MCVMKSGASSGPEPGNRLLPAKVAVLGGSSAFTPALADALADAARDLPDLEVRLHGRNEQHLTVITRFCNRLARRRCVPHEYTRTLSVTEACRDARVIVNQMRVGGWAGRAHDDTFPLEFGIPGDETIGPGGLASAVRSVPVVLAAAREAAAAAAPGAWFLNMTNPLGILLSALGEVEGLRAVGLCELPGLTLEKALRLAGVPGGAEEVEKDYLGLNHQGWFVRIRFQGEDLLPRIFARAGEAEAAAFFKVDPEKMESLHALPLPYMRIYYHTAREAERAKARAASRGEELAALSRRLYEAYEASGEGVLPGLIRRRGLVWIRTALVPALSAILGGEARTLYVSERNGGYIPGLPPGAVVEKRALLGPEGVKPYPFLGMRPEREGPLGGFVRFLEKVVRFEAAALEAARDPSVERIVEALRIHPLGIDEDTARALVPRVLEPVEAPSGPSGAGEEGGR